MKKDAGSIPVSLINWMFGIIYPFTFDTFSMPNEAYTELCKEPIYSYLNCIRPQWKIWKIHVIVLISICYLLIITNLAGILYSLYKTPA